jgi:hypothetical protein
MRHGPIGHRQLEILHLLARDDNNTLFTTRYHEQWHRVGTVSKWDRILQTLVDRGLIVWDGAVTDITLTPKGRSLV